MPTVEIIAVGCEVVPEFPSFSMFDLEAETELQSHRWIFQEVFDKTTGIIVHLLNKGPGPSFADQLFEWSQDGYIVIPETDPAHGDDQWQGEDQENDLRFLPTVIPELKYLFEMLLHCSPTNRIYFSTDYQFGPGKALQKEGYTVSSFFKEHDESHLRFNTLYHITKD